MVRVAEYSDGLNMSIKEKLAAAGAHLEVEKKLVHRSAGSRALELLHEVVEDIATIVASLKSAKPAPLGKAGARKITVK